ncbi:MAG TPA: hypothetical protein VEQ66_09470 [Propionibacteriaceae bacterium]|nr:hypothetical protein [Propionibacteriaceae bacterium]
MPSRPAGRAPGGSRAGDRRSRWPLTRRWTILLALLAVVFVALRVVHASQPAAVESAITTRQLVVVGVTGRFQLNETDRAVLGGRLSEAQVGAVSVRPRFVGDCAAAGWATLGSGRRAGVAGRCDPQVQGSRVQEWPQWQAATAAQRGDARLGNLAELATGCVGAVGPGAGLAAARPDGSLATYQSADEFLRRGGKVTCPVTLVDGGVASDAIISAVARRPEVTLLVTGVGPAAGSTDPGLQVVYRVRADDPGWLTSRSTRRDGLVTLADVTRTVIDFGRRTSGARDVTDAQAEVDGAPLAVEPEALTLPAVEQHLRSTAALSDAAVTGYLTLGAVGAVLFVLAVVGAVLGRLQTPRLVAVLGCVLGAVMMLVGSVRWWQADRPGLVVGLALAGWAVAMTAAALAVARLLRVPSAVAAAALTVTAFTVDAALGAALQPGSLLNSRPVAGARWYGFGNITFSIYANAGLVLAGYLGHRFTRSGHRVAAMVGAGAVGFGVVICQGWPTMGTDFGGVLSLTPGLLWLLLMLSGTQITWIRTLLVGGSGVLAVALISFLDWRRGSAARTHLGNFVQRALEGDAVDIISRKALTAYQTAASPGGVVAVVLGVVCWVLIFRRLMPVIQREFTTLRPVGMAVLATAILGTLLNDGGVHVWLTVTASFVLTMAALWFERSDHTAAAEHLDWAGPRSR